MKIAIPMAGKAQRFVDEGYTTPKPLIDVKGKPMIQLVIESLRPNNYDYQFIFIVQKLHCEKFNIDKVLKDLEPNCEIVVLDKVTEGSAITLLSASHLFYNDEVVVTVCDNITLFDFDDFIKKARNKDGLITTFETSSPNWCFTEIKNGKFIKCVEKSPISTHAHTGVWYFKHGSKLISALGEAIYLNDRTNNEFYSTIAYNYLDGDIDIYDAKILPLGTPKELNEYINSSTNV